MKYHSTKLRWISTVLLYLAAWESPTGGICAQSLTLDSLRQIVRDAESPHERRTAAYLELMRSYWQISTDSALRYAELGLESALESDSSLWAESASAYALKQAVLTGQRNIFFTALVFTLTLLVIIVVALITRNRQNQQIRKQQEELQRLNQLKDRFFTLLSHDLRAPIAKCRSLLGTLTQQPGSDHVKQHFEEISNMLDQLLMWAKSQLHYIKVSRVPTNLYSLTASLETFFYMEASEKSLTLINNIPADMHTLTDPNILEVALRNLLSNALRHTPPEGTVVLSAQQEHNGAVYICITDTGAGIDDSLCGQLSSKQILEAVGNRSGGSGVGLLLSHDMVALLGGQLYARRLDEGGSEFKIVLPVVG